MAFESIKSAASSVGNAAKSAGTFLWENKGKIVVGAAAVGAAVYYREEIAEFTNSMLTKATEVPTVEVPTVEA